MGAYLNPGNRGFQEILQSEYVDKTGRIALINRTVGTMEKLSCVSRPWRFGKSYAAKMLCAYYLGYLTCHEESGTVRIPNEEVKSEFRKILTGTGVSKRWIELIGRSRKLLTDTIAGNSEDVAGAIETIRDTQYAPTFYNDEQALRYVVKFAYIAAIDQYLKIEELPSGRGIADVVYLPKQKSPLPALVIELKWNQSSGGAVEQIRRKNYPAVLQDCGSEIMMVGINYDAKTKNTSAGLRGSERQVVPVPAVG